jgi:hypothetical protein
MSQGRSAFSKTSEHPSREVEQGFRLMVENSQDILTIRDADARVRYTSPSIHPSCSGLPTGRNHRFHGVRVASSRRSLHCRKRAKRILEEPWRAGFHPIPRPPRERLLGFPGSGRLQFAGPPGNSWRCHQRPRHYRAHADGSREGTRHCRIAGSDLQTGHLNGPLGHLRFLQESSRRKWQLAADRILHPGSLAEFTHAMCPECSKIWYPDHFQK